MLHRIEDVPRIRQKPNWCGYVCLSMVLNYWGHDISQDELFDHINGPTPEDEQHTSLGIGIGNLAIAAQELTPLRADLWSEERYVLAHKNRPNLQPHDVLKTYLSKDIPCIVRIPHHYNVAIGFGTDNDEYYFNETDGHEIKRSSRQFEHLWSHQDPLISYDTRHLILAVRPHGKL